MNVWLRRSGCQARGHPGAGGASYRFDAQLAGDALTFVTDDARYVLQRVR